VEIQDYLKVLGKRAWLLVMIPAVAGVAAGLIAVQQPQAFRTTATLQLPRDQNNSAPAQVAQQVADFKAAAANSSVQNKVAHDTGVPIRRIKKLAISQVGVSSQLTMGMQGKQKNPSDAKAVITGIATNALNYLQAPDVAAAQKTVDDATAKLAATQQGIDKATNDLNALYQKSGTSDPAGDVKRYQSLVDDWTLKVADAAAAGNPTQVHYYQSLIAQRQLQIAGLMSIIPTVTSLQQTISDGTKSLATEQTDRDTAVKALAAIATVPDLVFSAEGTPVIRKTRVVKTAAAAVVAGFPIAVGIVLLLDAMQRRRQAKRAAAAQAERESFAPSEDEAEVPVAAGAALLVGSRASPAPVAGVEPIENGRSTYVVAKEPALLVGGGRTAAATAAAMDEDDEDDDEPDDGDAPGPHDPALDLDDEDERDVLADDEPLAVDIGDEADEQEDDAADLAVTDLDDEGAEDAIADVDDEEAEPAEATVTDEEAEPAEATVADEETEAAVAEDDVEDDVTPVGALDADDEDVDDEDDDAALLARDEDELDTEDDLDTEDELDELDDEDDLATADDLDDDDLDELDAEDDLETDDESDGLDDLLDEDEDDIRASQNGLGRARARVPDAEEAFEDDDEGHEPST
jgi:hypothetical protein